MQEEELKEKPQHETRDSLEVVTDFKKIEGEASRILNQLEMYHTEDQESKNAAFNFLNWFTSSIQEIWPGCGKVEQKEKKPSTPLKRSKSLPIHKKRKKTRKFEVKPKRRSRRKKNRPKEAP